MFKKFVFLIWDWGWLDEYYYGKDGGKKYVLKVLEVGNLNEYKLKYVNIVWFYILY